MARKPNTLSSDRTADDPNADTLRPEYVPGTPVLPDEIDAEALARRKLLKIAAYTVPLVVGTLIAGPADAGSKDSEWCDQHDPNNNSGLCN
jgi:hypothetical protein